MRLPFHKIVQSIIARSGWRWTSRRPNECVSKADASLTKRYAAKGATSLLASLALVGTSESVNAATVLSFEDPAYVPTSCYGFYLEGLFRYDETRFSFVVDGSDPRSSGSGSYAVGIPTPTVPNPSKLLSVHRDDSETFRISGVSVVRDASVTTDSVLSVSLFAAGSNIADRILNFSSNQATTVSTIDAQRNLLVFQIGDSGAYRRIDLSGADGVLSFDDVIVTAIPEPGGVTLIGFLTVATVFRRNRRRPSVVSRDWLQAP